MKKMLCIITAITLMAVFLFSGCSGSNQSSETAKKIEPISSVIKLDKTLYLHNIKFDINSKWEVDHSDDYSMYTIFSDDPDVMISVSATENSVTEDEFFSNLKKKIDTDIVEESFISLTDDTKTYYYTYNYTDKKDNKKEYCERYAWIHGKYSYSLSCMGDSDSSDKLHEIMNNIACSVIFDDTEDYTGETIPTEIGGYIYAEFDKYNSPAEENGLGNTKVFTQGQITEVYNKDEQLLGTLEANDGTWTLVFGSYSTTTQTDLLTGYSFKDVCVKGMYMGFSNVTQKPVIFAETVEKDGEVYTIGSINYDEINAATEQTEKPKDTTEETTAASSETLTATHKLYEDDRIALSYVQMYDYKYDSDKKIIEFFAENKTDKELTIQSGLVSIDGISYNKVIMSDSVFPNSKGIVEMTVNQAIPTNSPKSIGLTINYFDGALGDTIHEHGIVISEITIG